MPLRRLLFFFIALFLLSLQSSWAAESTNVGDSCTGALSRGDWDTIFQCVSSSWKRAPLWLGTSSDTCDSSHAGIIQWNGSDFTGCNGTSWTSLVAAGGNDSYTKLLLHMDGTNGGTTFTDSSSTANSVTPTSATTSTAASKFGGASALFTGSSSYLSIPNSTNWDFGSGDFTIDAWVYFNGFSSSSYQYFYSQAILNSTHLQFGYNNSAGMDYEDSVGCTFTQGSTSGWTTGTWYHVALVRYGTTMTMYRNGTALATKTCSVALPSVGTTLYVGAALAGYHYLNGYIDELRVSKGVARWTTSFTPPGRAYN